MKRPLSKVQEIPTPPAEPVAASAELVKAALKAASEAPLSCPNRKCPGKPVMYTDYWKCNVCGMRHRLVVGESTKDAFTAGRVSERANISYAEAEKLVESRFSLTAESLAAPAKKPAKKRRQRKKNDKVQALYGAICRLLAKGFDPPGLRLDQVLKECDLTLFTFCLELDKIAKPHWTENPVRTFKDEFWRDKQRHKRLYRLIRSARLSHS